MSEVDETVAGVSSGFETMLVVDGPALEGLSPAELENLRAGVELMVGWHLGASGVRAAIGKRVVGSPQEIDGATYGERMGELTDHLRIERIVQGLSQAELGQATGTTQSAISEFEGRIVLARLYTLLRQASALGVRLELVLAPRNSEADGRETVLGDNHFVVYGDGLETMTPEQWDVLRLMLDSFGLNMKIPDGQSIPKPEA